MPLETLLVCTDKESLRHLTRALEDLGVDLEVISEPDQAQTRLLRWRFDAVIVDCDATAQGAEVLKQVRDASRNQKAVTFAVVSNSISPQSAFSLGASFVLEKPLTREKIDRLLRAAHGLMLRERLRYYRHSVYTPVTVVDGMQEYGATAVNLSGSGVAIKFDRNLTLPNTVQLRLTLPGSKVQIATEAELIWVKQDEWFRGYRFTGMSDPSRIHLQKWIDENIPTEEIRPKPRRSSAVRGK